jgi:hypothetical protein
MTASRSGRRGTPRGTPRAPRHAREIVAGVCALDELGCSYTTIGRALRLTKGQVASIVARKTVRPRRPSDRRWRALELSIEGTP